MKHNRTVQEIMKFSWIGVLNTAVDFCILNALLAVFGVGYVAYLFCKSVAFSVAALNSYVWNKWWVFRRAGVSRSRVSAREASLFLLTSVAGLLVNAGVAFLAFVGLRSADATLSVVFAANVSALLGTLVVLGMNFVSYKFIVFRPTAA